MKMGKTMRGAMAGRIGDVFARVLNHSVTAWTILLSSFVVTGLAWQISDNFVRQRAEDRFRFEVADITSALGKRMLEYEALLRGGVGLFVAFDHVTRGAWHEYVDTLAIDRYFPGIQGIGHSLLIAPSDLADHVATVRAEGFPEYTVRPDGQRDVYTSIVYLEPFAGRNLRAFGYDMLSEPVRRRAMERARDTGDAAISGIVTLVQETATDVQRGFLMYLPLYRKGAPTGTVDERRAAHIGFVYSPFRINDLMRGILGASKSDISFEIFDSDTMSPGALLYDHDGDERVDLADPDHRPELASTETIPMGGHRWTVYIHSNRGFVSAAEASQPLVVAVGGVMIDLLLFHIISSASRQQRRAVALAEAMTRELQDSRAILADKAETLEQVNRSLDQFTHVLAHHLQEPVRLQYMFAQRLETLLPTPLSPQAAQAFNHVLTGARRLRTLLHDVERYLSAHRLQPPETPCDADAVLDAVLGKFDRAIRDAGATVERHPLPALWIGGPELNDVLSVVIDNAIRFRHPDRALLVRIAAERRADGKAVVSIRDNGIGIDPDYRERVFGVFERLRRDQDPASTGFGLSLARRIVESIDGRIWIDDNADENGLCVRVALRAEVG